MRQPVKESESRPRARSSIGVNKGRETFAYNPYNIKVCTVFLIIGTVHMHVIVKEDACLFDFLPFSIVL